MDATDQATDHEHPNRPQSHEANRGHAAATRSENWKQGAGDTRWTHKANQENTAEKPKAYTTEEAEGKGETNTGKT